MATVVLERELEAETKEYDALVAEAGSLALLRQEATKLREKAETLEPLQELR